MFLRERERERERSTRGHRVLFSSVGLWEGFLGVKITRIPYRFVGCDPMVGGLPPTYLCLLLSVSILATWF